MKMLSLQTTMNLFSLITSDPSDRIQMSCVGSLLHRECQCLQAVLQLLQMKGDDPN